MTSARSERPRSAADALIAVALLLFIVGWVALWGIGMPTDKDEKIDGGAALLLLVVIFGPPFWAGLLVTAVVADRG